MTNHWTEFWATTNEKLEKKFNVVEHIHLIKEDEDLEPLKQRLLRSKLKSYTKNDRYVIVDDDTHYYTDSCSYSLTWYNLVKIFLDTDIPLSSIIVFHNGSGLLEQILPLIPKELQDQNCVPAIIDLRSSCWVTATSGTMMIVDNFDKDRISDKPITRHAISMMGQPRIHRNILQNHIKENKLFDKIAVAYNNVS